MAFAAALGDWTRQQRQAPSGLHLLRNSALRTPPPDLPDAQTRRDVLSITLRSAEIRDASIPPDGRTARARVVAQLMQKEGRSSPGDLDDDETIGLALLLRLLRADAAEAGALAQLFRDPSAVLDLRDEVRRIIARRKAYDRDQTALAATEAMLSEGRTLFPDMASAVKALRVDDIDLWHQVVQWDPLSPAAMWCASQPGCDRASVALVVAAMAREGRLLQAIDARDKTYIDTARALFKRWSSGGYMVSELGLKPKDLGSDPSEDVSQMLNAVATRLNEPRWAEPCGLFAAGAGRPLRERTHWDLARAELVCAPRPLSYLRIHLS